MSYPAPPATPVAAAAAAAATATASRPQVYHTPSYISGNHYLPTKIEGEYATLEILNKDGNPLPLYTCSHRPATELWVCCNPGEAFAIRYSNKSSDKKCTRAFDIFVDGVQITDFYMNGGGVHTVDKLQTGTVETGTYMNVVACLAYLFITPTLSTLSTPATGTKVVLNKLTFKLPPTPEEQQPLHGEQQLEEVARISLKVSNAVRKKRTFHKGLVTEPNKFNIHDVARGMEIASATLAEEENIVDDIEFVSNFRIGGQPLETLEVRFGYLNQLLRLGADVRLYRNSQIACRIPRGAMRTPSGYTAM